MAILPLSYYQKHDALWLSQDLLGKYLITNFNGILTGGAIIETEAYQGPEDRAAHSYNNRRTKRTEVMFQEGGVCYVYQCYGIHFLLNIIANKAEVPHGVLIRAIQPEIGIEEMLKRRQKTKMDKTLTNGPASLTQALGIDIRHNRLPINEPPIWIEDRKVKVKQVISGPRIGIDYAGPDALLPWRFQAVL